MCTESVGCASLRESFLYENDQRENGTVPSTSRMHLVNVAIDLGNVHKYTQIQMTLQKDNEKRLIQSSNSDTFNIHACSIDNKTATRKNPQKRQK